METTFFFFELESQGRISRHKLRRGNAVVVGRSTTDAQVVVEEVAVSRKHLSISFGEQGLFVMDNGSSNGTYRDNQMLVPHQWVAWRDGELRLGGLAGVRLKWLSVGPDRPMVPGEPGQRDPNGQRQSETRKPARDLRSMLQQKGQVVIGRSADCDWVLNEVMVSRKHARVYESGGEVWVEDLNSTNGTYVNGKPISSKTKLRERDKLLVGLQLFTLEAGEVTQSEFAIVAEGISKVFSNGVQGLQDTTLKLPYQEFVALMGPSGCGKSTLLKALNGDSPPTSGQVTIFNLDLQSNFEAIKHVIGYVPQENIVHEQLSVEQSLYFAAKIRLPEDTTDSEIKDRISEVLKALKIDAPHLRTTPVSKLSGGQKKRVCIAVEMLTKPKVLFLDEPTSPLDPETIEEFLNCIRSLCKQGTTVVMVTHKPEDLAFVDRVVFMGVQGHLAYDGRKDGLLTHFRKENIIQLYTLLSDKAQASQWHQQWFKNQSKPVVAFRPMEVNKSHANPFKQLFWLTSRYFHIKFADNASMGLMIVQPVFIALLVVLSYNGLTQMQDLPGPGGLTTEVANMGVLFLTAIAAIWFGVSNSAKEIVGEWDVALREFRVNVMLFPYLLSKQIVLNTISALQIAIFLGILAIAYEDLNVGWEMYGALLLLGSASIQFGLLLSAVARSTEVVMSMLPLALMPQIILSGFLTPLASGVTALLSSLTLGRWGTELLVRIQDDGANPTLFLDQMEKGLYNADVDFIESGTLDSNLLGLVLLFVITLMAILLRLNMRIRPSA